MSTQFRLDDVVGQSSPVGELESQNYTMISGFSAATDLGNIETNLLSHNEITIPDEFQLYQNFPNPFNPSTTIRYNLPEPGDVNLSIYNVYGQLVQILVNEYQSAGIYQAQWNSQHLTGQTVSSGIYLYRLSTQGHIFSKKLMLLR